MLSSFSCAFWPSVCLLWRTYLQNRNRLTDIENKLMVTKGEMLGGVHKSGAWDDHTHTTIYKIDNQQGPIV